MRFDRYFYNPANPQGKNGRRVTESKKHLAIAKELAIEGTVLLKNDGTLPLPKGERVCVFGRGAGEWIFGGGGSSAVRATKKVSLTDALESADARGQIRLFHPLVADAKRQVKAIFDAYAANPTVSHHTWNRHRSLCTLPVEESLYQQAVSFGGTALFTLLRFSSEGTVDGDRTLEKGDFTLYDEERVLLERLQKDFKKVVVITCVCGPVETKIYQQSQKIGAVIYSLFGGALAGEALVDILTGVRYPSGHLQDTLAENAEDYPFTADFHAYKDHVDYTEDIFVGYRYFETFCPEKVVYPFGYGLGYTTFRLEYDKATRKKDRITLTVKVTNTGNFPGKEVVQAYLSAPQGKLGKAKRELCAFKKTRELQPGEQVTVTLPFDLKDFAAFDDLGKIEPCAFVLERGTYTVFCGNNVRDAEAVYSFERTEDTVVSRHQPHLAPKKLSARLLADGTMEKLPAAEEKVYEPVRYVPKAAPTDEPLSLEKALEQDRLDQFLANLTNRELGELLYGHTAVHIAQTGFIGLYPAPRPLEGENDFKKIPPVPTADGPCGLRFSKDCKITCTFFPCANTLSQTWNLSLARKMGKVCGIEATESNIGIWLAPALNIHRSPLCGRNFEYLSEDPLATGTLGSAIIEGVQSQKVGATVKHFCCNNKEINRKYCDSRVSQRAIREIYLKAFEIAIKKASPWCVMTGYNLVNGQRCSGSWEQNNGILKGEWNYQGLVMTDWWPYSLLRDDLYGGNDVRMPSVLSGSFPGSPREYDPCIELENGTLDRGAALEAARRIFLMFDHLE